MGLLDDAIREHLELKRRHGADPTEVERQEEEVLGGTPKAAEFAPATDEAPEAPEEEPAAQVVEPVEPVESEEREPFDVDSIDPPAEPEVPPPGEVAGAPGHDEDPWLEEERDEVPADESLSHPPAAEPEQAAAGEDVLQDTPDFLQETPEHDRLWFEQRPPRDFDWDK
jgi:hypothetical protein